VIWAITASRALQALDPRSGETRRTLKQSDTSCLALSRDGRRIAALVYPDPPMPRRVTLVVWDAVTGSELIHWNDREVMRLECTLALTRDGRRVATALEDGSIVVLSTETGAVRFLSGRPAPVLGLAFTPDGTRLAADRLGEGQLRLWDVDSGTEVLQLRSAGAELTQYLDFSPDGQRLLVGVFGNNAPHRRGIRIWDASPIR
jgi:WD40 repeat protein